MGKERLLGLALLLELVQDVKSLSDLGIESLLGVEEVQKLVVVHLEQHARDLARELGVLVELALPAVGDAALPEVARLAGEGGDEDAVVHLQLVWVVGELVDEGAELGRAVGGVAGPDAGWGGASD